MSLPLNGVRVLELADGLGESAGRFLADLGAEVTRPEPPAGSRSRTAPPTVDGLSIGYALANANKRVRTVDPATESGRAELTSLIAGADIVIDAQSPYRSVETGIDVDALREARPELVWLSLSPFGPDGPYAGFAADEAVLYALSGVLSRSGAPDATPLLPPRGLADQLVAVHTVWAVLLAWYRGLRTGRGDHIELNAFEAVVHGFDPGFGTQGSAAAGRTDDYPRNRPDAARFYPVYNCRDGQVRLCLLAPRQWQAMFAWLGSPDEFADPKYNTIGARFAASDRLDPLISALFSDQTRDELIAEGARRGVPVGGVLGPGDALDTPHFTESGALVDTEIAPGVTARIPAGYATFDGLRAGFRTPVSTDSGAPAVPRPARTATGDDAAAPPLAGLRVLDLGVIVFGAELTRQFADYGADVVKVENATHPDGLRQSKRGAKISASVVWGHRNKRSLGIDLRSSEGADVFRRLVAEADVVTANFKPGTLASMGFGYDELARLNPRIIVSESSAFGDTGPWRGRLGYGPLVRAATGVSALWRYPDDATLLCDGSTVYPDHVAGHIAACTVLAALIAREATGAGARITLAQSDTALMQIGSALAVESLAPGTAAATGNSDPHAAPSGVYACAGDDEWCVVTAHDDQQWAALCTAIGRPELSSDPRMTSAAQRRKHRAVVDEIVADWTATRSPREVMESLQAAQIPAAPMLRLPDLLSDPQLKHHGTYTTLAHPLLSVDLPAAARSAHFTEITDPPVRPAPLAGEHTAEICREWLGMADEEVDQLTAAGTLQVPAAD